MAEIRTISKKNWRAKIEPCLELANNINECLRSSKSFLSLNPNTKRIFLNGVSSAFVYENAKRMLRDNYTLGENYNSLYEKESQLWQENEESFSEIENECKFSTLKECCEENFKLENFKGYSNFAEKTNY